jgi:NitT/TauT family transport system ATP-binding protein
MTARRDKGPAVIRRPGTGFPGGIGSVLPRSLGPIALGPDRDRGFALPFNGKADLPKIASDLQMEIDELFPVAETLQLMRIAEVEAARSSSPRGWRSPMRKTR